MILSTSMFFAKFGNKDIINMFFNSGILNFGFFQPHVVIKRFL